jgi:uncharacterized protein (DUF4415 family)
MTQKASAKQTAHRTYMMDVMRRLEWDFHHVIELTDRIPEDWHAIAKATPNGKKMQVNLKLDSDVVRFFKSMGEGYGPRINMVLKSYMHARLAGVIKGAETANYYRQRDEGYDVPKPAFGDIDKMRGRETELNDGPEVIENEMMRISQMLQMELGVGPVAEELRVFKQRSRRVMPLGL